MLRLTHHITIGTWTIDFPVEVEIEEDINTLTDTCKITLPKKVVWKDKDIVTDPPLKRFDEVSVSLGYDDKLKKVFSGFVRDVKGHRPMEIFCEDAMMKHKTQQVKKQEVRGSLQDIVKPLLDLNPRHGKGEGKTKLGSYRYTYPTVTGELNELKKDYGLKIFYKNEQLYICWITPYEISQSHRFAWGKNILSQDLRHTSKDSIKLQIKATSHFEEKRENIIVEVGDNEGEKREIHAYNLDKADLKAFAEKQYERLTQDKYDGSFTTFGEPMVQKLDKIEFQGQEGNQETYIVDKVVHSYGQQGYRQDITLGNKIA